MELAMTLIFLDLFYGRHLKVIPDVYYLLSIAIPISVDLLSTELSVSCDGSR